MQPTPIILIASADAATRNLLASYLEGEGYVLLTAYDAVVALEAVQHNRVAVVLVAVSHPVTAEVELCRELISNDGARTLPLLILLAERSDQAQFEALGLAPEQIGALPCTRIDVQLHIRRILRDTRWGQRVRNHVLRKHQDGDRILVAGDLTIDRDRREVTRGGKLITVATPRMFDLLVYLVSNEGVTLTRQQILTHVWGYVPASTTTVAVHVRWLRELLEDDPSDPHRICTVQRVGYRFVAAGTATTPYISGEPRTLVRPRYDTIHPALCCAFMYFLSHANAAAAIVWYRHGTTPTPGIPPDGGQTRSARAGHQGT